MKYNISTTKMNGLTSSKFDFIWKVYSELEVMTLDKLKKPLVY